MLPVFVSACCCKVDCSFLSINFAGTLLFGLAGCSHARQRLYRCAAVCCLRLQQVAREGTKKTVFTNFMDLCKAMNRNNEHVSAYLLAELGTSGSLDGQQRLSGQGPIPAKVV